jgi:hypothetical protein
VECVPAQPEVLWETFRHQICDDLLHRLHTFLRTMFLSP